MRLWRPFAGLLATAIALTAATGADFQAAVTDLQRGDSAGAEQKLRAELKAHPDEVEALSLLGVALDNQKKFGEAGPAHQQAVAKAPNSPGILNNYGNHLLLAGDPDGARDIFLKTVALEAANAYANLQLAQLAVRAGNGKDALQYLDRLPAQQMDAPNVAIFRLEALDLLENRVEAEALFHKLSSATESDAALSSSLGLQLAQTNQFTQAETFLTHALAADPTNFSRQYQLGAVASRAGDNTRARDVFEKALRQQPQNVDVLYGLAFVYSALKQPEQAVRLLSQASRLAPQRADVQKLLAVTTGDLRAFEDSVVAWDRYIALAPADDTGRRERGFAKTNMKQPDGLADLEWYSGRHPEDPVGLFELGVAQSVADPDQGLATLDKVVALKPDFADARSARGALNYQQGKADVALPDLEFAAAKMPDNALVLDRLGQTYQLLDRAQDAVRVLRKAAALAPGDSKTQLHLANALAQAGETAESRVFMNRYRELGGTAAVPARGVMEYLSLTPEQQHAAYRTRVEKGIADKPDDASLQVAYLKILISDRQMAQALAVARKIAGMKPGAILLADAGRAMLTARQYPAAKELLEMAATADPAAGLDLDLAVSVFHVDGGAAGIAQMDHVPPTARGGDYFAARAQMLEAAGKADEAVAAATLAVKTEPNRSDLYWQAATMLIKNRRNDEALRLMDQAEIALPENAVILVVKAMVLELSGKTSEAQNLLSSAGRRWPEMPAIWVEQGIILAAHGRGEDGRKALATGISLGGHTSSAVDPAKLFLVRPPEDW